MKICEIMENKNLRDRVIVRASWVSTIGNAVLSASKIAVGLIGGSLAVLGDGIDSATDVIISVVMIITAGIINRPPSRKYAYGYEKAEGIATMILSLVIFYAGIQMLISSIESMISDEPRVLPSLLTIWITVFSIAGKLLLALYQYRQGRRVNSPMLTANAVNMRNDVLISTGVLVGLAFTFIFDLPILDSVTGLAISLFILKSSVEIFIGSNVELMDGVQDEGVYNKIFEAVECVSGASNPHVRSRLIGGMYMIMLHIEVDGLIPLNKAHDIAHEVEDSIRATIDNIYDIVVHVEPLGDLHPEEKFTVDSEMLDK